MHITGLRLTHICVILLIHLDVSPSKDSITHPIPAEVLNVFYYFCTVNICAYTCINIYVCAFVCKLVAADSKGINGGQHTKSKVNVVETKKLL